MAGGGRNQPKKRSSQVRLSQQRFRRRLNRRGKHYGRRTFGLGEQEIKNPSFRLTKKPKGYKNIILPNKLRQDSPEHIEPLIEVCSTVRHFSLEEPVKKLVIDFRSVQEIEPSMALILLAEIKRCIAYSSGRTYITGTYPASDQVAQLLSDLGFFEALGVKDPGHKLSKDERTFVKVTQHRHTDAELIDRMLSTFSEEVDFTNAERKTLHLAFLECMDNVRQHAYIWDSKNPHLYREWWMAGFIDHRQREIQFLFYDQGLGIPYTIKKRKHRRVLDKLFHWGDADWIARALRRRESRHASQRRGHGLKRLRRFSVVSKKKVALRIVSNSGCYLLDKHRNERKEKLKYSLGGTLIEWSLNAASISGEQ